MTLTSCARQPTRTRSAFRSSVLTKPPTSSASSRLYTSSSRRGAARAVAVDRVAAAGAVPDVPLVERQPDALARSPKRLDVVAHRGDLANLAIHVEIHRQVPRGAVPRQRPGIAVIGVQRDSVHLVEALLQHFPVPDQVCRHVGAARSAGDQLQPAVDATHLSRDVARLAPVFARLQLADLPGAIHLVAQAPVAHVVRLRRSRATAAARSTSCRDRGCSTRRRRPPSPRCRCRSSCPAAARSRPRGTSR